MPGMNSGTDRLDHVLARAFMTALLHQGLIALALLAVLAAAWVGLRRWRFTAQVPAAGAAGTAGAEPAGRRVLRIGFGLLWLLDGILQAQPNMPAGLPSQVIEPTAGASPPWVQHVVHWGQATWASHPVPAGSATVWIRSEHAGRAALAGDRADRGGVSALGAARRALGPGHLGQPPGPGGLRHGVDPGRARCLAAGGAARDAVPARRAGQRGLGTGRVGVRRIVRRDLRARPDLADRSARRGARLRGRGSPDRAAPAGLALAAGRPADPGRAGAVPGRDGGAPGPAEPRVLAGGLVRTARTAGRDGPVDGSDAAARLPVRLGRGVRLIR